MMIISIKSTVLVVFGTQHDIIDSNNVSLYDSIHLYSIILLTIFFSVLLTFLELVEAVDARLVRSLTCGCE